MRLGARCESGDLLVPHMQPLDAAVSAHRIGNAVQAVANNTVDPLDACRGQHFNKLISYGLSHFHPHADAIGETISLILRRWTNRARRTISEVSRSGISWRHVFAAPSWAHS